MDVFLVVLGLISVIMSTSAFVLVLLLLAGKESRYAKWRDLDTLRIELRDIVSKMTLLWRYLEAVDDATGGVGHRVLLSRMPDDDTPKRHR